MGWVGAVGPPSSPSPCPPSGTSWSLMLNMQRGRECDEGVRDARRYCTEPRRHGFTIPTAQGREGGGRQRALSPGAENHFLCCQVRLAQSALISLPTGLATGHWPIKSAPGQRAIGVFDWKTKGGEGWRRAEGGRSNGRKS